MCLEEMKSGRTSERKAAKSFNIPRSTIKKKLKGAHLKAVGAPQCYLILKSLSTVPYKISRFRVSSNSDGLLNGC